MISTLKKFLSRQDGREHLVTPAHEEADFVLQYGELAVARLWLREGTWHFEYTDAFRAQASVRPLVDFPNPDKRYESESLWPFFAVRIPSMAQPAIRRVVRDEHLDETNEAQLLKRFGKSTIASPFQLEAAL